MLLNKDIVVLSECCSSPIFSEEKNAYRIDCSDCGLTIMSKGEYSPSFPVSALKMKRAPNYWYGWGEFWFGWKELNITAEGF